MFSVGSERIGFALSLRDQKLPQPGMLLHGRGGLNFIRSRVGAAGVGPQTGAMVLVRGPLLQHHLSARGEYEDRNRPVAVARGNSIIAF